MHIIRQSAVDKEAENRQQFVSSQETVKSLSEQLRTMMQDLESVRSQEQVHLNAIQLREQEKQMLIEQVRVNKETIVNHENSQKSWIEKADDLKHVFSNVSKRLYSCKTVHRSTCWR